MRPTSWLAACVLCAVAGASPVQAQSAPPAQAGGKTTVGSQSLAPAAPPQAPPALTEAQQCSVERHALQAQVVELRARVVELQTALDRQALAAERQRLEGTLPIAPGWQWDWQTLRMVPAATTQTEPR